jgi:hypothetical protein
LAPRRRRVRLDEQVGHALLRPAARLATSLRVSLRTLGGWVQIAYFHELQSRGHKMREIAEHLDISMRKVALLSSQHKHTFFDVLRGAELPRRVEFLLWARPLSRARILQTLPGVSAKAVDSALAVLVREGRLREIERSSSTVYERVSGNSRLVSSQVFARLDGLHNLLANVYNAIVRRFFHDDDRAFARTVSARLREDDLVELRALYENVIWPKIVALENDRRDDDEAMAVDISVLWAPGAAEGDDA